MTTIIVWILITTSTSYAMSRPRGIKMNNHFEITKAIVGGIALFFFIWAMFACMFTFGGM